MLSRLRRRSLPPSGSPPDLESDFLALWQRAAPFTMTSIERAYALWQAIRYVVSRRLEGDIIECGVWRGGSSLLAALALKQLGDTSRTLYLFDTFEGMPPASDRDVSLTGEAAAAILDRSDRMTSTVWAYASREDVQHTMSLAEYPSVNYVEGLVEATIPARAPDRIALLRLDTDWYESTSHELEHLYPRLVSGGVLIVDDYGHWRGARKAVDEYFEVTPVMLNRIDYTGRLIVKP